MEDRENVPTGAYLAAAKRGAGQAWIDWSVGTNASDVLRSARKAQENLSKAIERLELHVGD